MITKPAWRLGDPKALITCAGGVTYRIAPDGCIHGNRLFRAKLIGSVPERNVDAPDELNRIIVGYHLEIQHAGGRVLSPTTVTSVSPSRRSP